MTCSPGVLSFNNGKKRGIDQIPSYHPPRRFSSGLNFYQKSDGLSEYQAAFRKYPFQSRRQNIRPVPNRMENGSTVRMTTTYKQDYVKHIEKDVKGESFKPDQKYTPSSSKFSGKTMYQMSYKFYDAEIAKKCRPSLVRPGEPPKAPQSIELVQNTSNNEVKTSPEQQCCNPIPAPVPAEPNQIKKDADPINPIKKEGNGDQLLNLDNMKVTITTKNPGSTSKVQYVPWSGVTTFMADFPQHPYQPKLPSCKPPPSNNHYDLTPFDGRTTQSIAYKVWPVLPPEKPTWAIKPDYKRPVGGMPFDSTYMADFKSPSSIIARMMPIKPVEGGDIIKHESGNGDKKPSTTYQVNYLEWPGARPAKTFHQKQEYVPPKYDMDCQSIQRSHFTGQQTERSQLCRKISQHRELSVDKKMYFNTTYRDTYRDNRPKSCPAKVPLTHVLGVRRSEMPQSPATPKSDPNTTKDSGLGTLDAEPKI